MPSPDAPVTLAAVFPATDAVQQETFLDRARRLSSVPILLTALALVALGALAFLVDVPLAYAMLKLRVLNAIHRPLQIAEPFGDAVGILFMGLAIAVLDPRNRRFVPRVLTAGLGAGLIADIPKLLVGRTRPSRLDFDLVANAADTFTGWLPLFSGGSGSQSFPSAHTASAFAFAIAMVTLYPRGYWLFPLTAFLVGFQRVETGAHYLSDACCGAALGLVVGMTVVRSSRVASWFARYEVTPASTTEPALARTSPPLRECA